MATVPQILDAISSLGLTAQVRQSVDAERADILTQIKAAFLDAPNPTFWWCHLKQPHSSWQTDDAFNLIPQLTPDPNLRCWFVTDLTGDHEGLFLAPPALLPAILAECPYFG